MNAVLIIARSAHTVKLEELQTVCDAPQGVRSYGNAGDVERSEDPLILSLDTATGVRSVAIARGTRLLVLRAVEPQDGQVTSLLSEIDAALREANVRLGEIELFAAASGPGSFTGLRAGLATVKAFAATLARRTVGIPTLQAVARAAGPAARVVAAIPAGRGEVFAQLLDVTPEGMVGELESPEHLTPAALLDKAVRLGAALKWAGTGAHAHREAIRARADRESFGWREEASGDDKPQENSWTLAPPVKILAEHISSLALMRFRVGRTSSARDLHAIYVRPSDAELNERCHAPNLPSK